ncbi:MAG: M36 family metallopeptidase [Actinomycetota bacterium]
MVSDLLRRPARATLVFLALLAVAAGSLPVDAATRPPEAAAAFQGESGMLPEIDARGAPAAPSAEQIAAARRLGATVRWNHLGTPRIATGDLGPAAGATPAAAARRWLSANGALFGLSRGEAASLQVLAVHRIGKGHAVLLQQRAGGLPVAPDGLVTVGLLGGRAILVSSSMARDAGAPAGATLSPAQAVALAARDVGLPASSVSRTGRVGDWLAVSAKGLSGPVLVRPTAVPLPRGGAVAAYETFITDLRPRVQAFRHYIDGRTGQVLIRRNEVDFAGEPKWDVFPAYPPLDYSSTDTRETWCWEPAPDCDRVVANPAATVPWDVNARLGQSTRTTLGNAAWSREKWFVTDVAFITTVNGQLIPPPTDGILPATPRPNRDYQYPWTNTWLTQKCSELAFVTPQRNDLDAALANLFVGHNRMHDWSYYLGFTETAWNAQDVNFGRGGREGDPEHGNAQAGAVVSSGILNFLSRDNANQITPPDGSPPISNMFLWQPIAAAFYSKCVDGDFDMSVIGHEYTHLISNRMVAGPDQRLTGLQANAMGESWSDLVAQEYLNEYGFVPIADENPWAVGPYVANDKQRGIRNYAMNFPSSGLLPQPGVNPPVNPLNYSNVGYDLTGPQVHADGEIWSATQYDIRQAMIERYNAQFPASNQQLQEECADGRRPVTQCPGNRRWIQLVFDAWLLMANGAVDMLDARDAMLAADQARFGGANQDLLWNVFASRGMGEDAATTGTADSEPKPGFSSPYATEGIVRFAPVNPDGQPIPNARLFVGHYEARTTPVADTAANTELGDSVPMVPGQYDFLAQAPGYGMMRVTRRVIQGQETVLRFVLRTNLASAANGATASGDGVNHQFLIDDTENTNWAAFGGSARGRQVTVDLAGNTPVRVDRVNVSAMLRPPNSQDPNDPSSQNRFSALRQFEILTCRATTTVNCSAPEHFTSLYVSPPDAFPSIAPRPRAPELIFRSFDVPRTLATHVRLRVLENQCTGTPDYQGEQDNDPLNDTDCDQAVLAIVNILNGNQGRIVRAAELQVFDR